MFIIKAYILLPYYAKNETHTRIRYEQYIPLDQDFTQSTRQLENSNLRPGVKKYDGDISQKVKNILF